MNDNQKLVWVVAEPRNDYGMIDRNPLYVCQTREHAQKMASEYAESLADDLARRLETTREDISNIIRPVIVLDHEDDLTGEHDNEIVIYPQPQQQVWIVAWAFMWDNDQEVDTIHVCETLDVARMMAMEAVRSGEFNSDRPDYLEFKDKDSVDAHHQVVIYPVPMVSRLTVQ